MLLSTAEKHKNSVYKNLTWEFRDIFLSLT